MRQGSSRPNCLWSGAGDLRCAGIPLFARNYSHNKFRMTTQQNFE
jgi:hypothetical protein